MEPMKLRLPPQLFRAPGRIEVSKEMFEKIRTTSGTKPDGGLWTSTFDPRIGSAWLRWCCFNYDAENKARPYWLLTPKTCNVAVVHSLDDLKHLLERYGFTPEWWPRALGRRKNVEEFVDFDRYLDFAKMVSEYDAIHMTREGQWATHLSRPNLYGWDCESTLWLKWSFKKVERVRGKSKWLDGKHQSKIDLDKEAPDVPYVQFKAWARYQQQLKPLSRVHPGV